MSQNKRFQNVNLGNPKISVLWQSAVEIIRSSPVQSAAVEFETLAFMLLTVLGHEISSNTLVVVYHSAIEGENLEWLVDRLEHQRSKAS